MIKMILSEWEKIADETLRPGKWTEVYLTDDDPFMRRRWYCGDCKEWNTYGRTPFCPYCGKEKEAENNGEV